MIDSDVPGHFDSIPHAGIRAFPNLRIKGGVVWRVIDWWLIPKRSGMSHPTTTPPLIRKRTNLARIALTVRIPQNALVGPKNCGH